MKYQLAEINVARMKGVNIDDPIMQEFVDNLDNVNALAERSEGFIWRLKDENNNATSLNPFEDEQVIINISVWRDVDSLKHFTYKTFHSGFVKRRKEWFANYGKAFFALWWVEKGKMPTVAEAIAKLAYLEKHGPTELAFNFKTTFRPTTNG